MTSRGNKLVSSRKYRNLKRLRSESRSSVASPWITTNAKLSGSADEDSLFERIKQGDLSARDEVVARVQRIVIKKALKHRAWSGCLTLEDLIQEGNLGLLTAIEKYDHSRGLSFLTYAKFWITQKMHRAILNTGFAVRTPIHIWAKFQEWRRKLQAFENLHERAPLISEALGVCGCSIEEFEAMRRVVVSINAPIASKSNGDNAELGEILADGREVEVSLSDLLLDRARVQGLLAKLPKKSSALISLRYGIGGDQMTLEEVAEAYHLPKEKVREMEAKALRSLKKILDLPWKPAHEVPEYLEDSDGR